MAAPTPASSSIICSICLEDVSENCGRTVVTLQCADKFHLDCIGCAFNARGIMECPNCQAIENGVWKRFEHGNPQQAQDMERDTNSNHDRVPAMEQGIPASPIHGVIVQQPSSGANDLNANWASAPNFNCQWNNPPVPGSGLSTMDINNRWNGLPVLTDPCRSQLQIAQTGPFHEQGYISTMCGVMTESDHSLLIPANIIQPFDDPNLYCLGFDFEPVEENPFSFPFEDGNAPISQNGTLEPIEASMGSVNDQANTSNTVPSVDSPADSQSLHDGWTNNYLFTINDYNN